MVTFLKTILIILLVYYGLKFLLRLLSPYLLRYITKKAAQRFEGAFDASSFQSAKEEPEGSVTVDKMPGKDRSSGKQVGEYIDFEEIE